MSSTNPPVQFTRTHAPSPTLCCYFIALEKNLIIYFPFYLYVSLQSNIISWRRSIYLLRRNLHKFIIALWHFLSKQNKQTNKTIGHFKVLHIMQKHTHTTTTHPSKVNRFKLYEFVKLVECNKNKKKQWQIP